MLRWISTILQCSSIWSLLARFCSPRYSPWKVRSGSAPLSAEPRCSARGGSSRPGAPLREQHRRAFGRGVEHDCEGTFILQCTYKILVHRLPLPKIRYTLSGGHVLRHSDGKEISCWHASVYKKEVQEPLARHDPFAPFLPLVSQWPIQTPRTTAKATTEVIPEHESSTIMALRKPFM